MQRQDLPMNLGPGVQLVKFTITFTDLNPLSSASGTAANLTLLDDPGGNALNPAQFQIPQAGTVLFSRVNVTTAFTGGTLGAITMSVGTTGTTTLITAANSIFTTACFDKHGMNSEANSVNAIPVICRFSPTSDSLSDITAGSLDLYIAYLNVTYPVTTYGA